MKRLLVAVLAIAAGTAQANVWQHASEPGPATLDDEYARAMEAGDGFLGEARMRGGSIRSIKDVVQHAVDAYKIAAKARPREGEPWYRIGQVLHTFYFDCDNDPLGRIPQASVLCDLGFDRKKAEETIAAWDEFEKRSPLDPRLSFVDGEGAEVLFQRAILHTKLIERGTAKEQKQHLEAAAHDYEKIVARIDSSATNTEFYTMVVGNLAETYMMLDRLDDAVDTYREARRHGGRSSTTYGEAVALDRDERGGEALDLVRELGEEQVRQFHEEVVAGRAFFVPEGEKFYYYALLEEAFGHLADAAKYWQLYIASGAHPEFQPRAKQHLAALQAKHIRQEVPHLDWLDE